MIKYILCLLSSPLTFLILFYIYPFLMQFIGDNRYYGRMTAFFPLVISSFIGVLLARSAYKSNKIIWLYSLSLIFNSTIGIVFLMLVVAYSCGGA